MFHMRVLLLFVTSCMTVGLFSDLVDLRLASFPVALSDVVLLQGVDGEFIGIDASEKIVSKQSSLYDSGAHFTITSCDLVAKTITLQVGAKYVAPGSDGASLVLSATAASLPILWDSSTQKISFVRSGSAVFTIKGSAGQNLSSFKIVQKLTPATAIFDTAFAGMQKTLTKDIVVSALLNVFQSFMTKPQKTTLDWAFFYNFLSQFFTKAAIDVAEWKLPAMDIVELGKTKRISLCESAANFLGYIADPFSAAPPEVQSKARALQQTLTAQVQQSAVVTPAAPDGGFSQGSLVVLQSADATKTLFVSDQGVTQLLSGVTKFNTSVQAQVVAYDAAAKKIKLSYAGRFFDPANTAFTVMNAPAAQFFSLEATADPLVSYLSLGQGKRLVIGDRFSSGCSVDAQGTPFKIIPLNGVYLSLPLVKMPANSQELENSLKAYFMAFDGVRDSAEDMTFIFQSLKKYCELVGGSPDWFLPMKGTVIVNDSPLNYVKTSFQTMLTLKARYVGLNDALKASIQQFSSGVLFTPMQISSSLAVGALCYLQAGGDAAVVLDASGECKPQPLVSLFEPSIHAVIDRFDQATASLSLLLAGKKMAVNEAGKLVSAEAAGVFRVLTEPSGRYSLVSAQGKKLRYDQAAQSVSFADTGTVVEIVFMQAEQRVLGALSGDAKKDLKLFEKVLLQVRADAKETDFIVGKLIRYAQQASQDVSWYTAVGVDDKNPKATVREYASKLLTRVRDSSSIFTAVAPALKDRISAAVKEIEDNNLLYARQIDSLDELAKKLTESSMVMLSSELVVTLNGLIENIMKQGTADLRNTLLQKVESYTDSSVIGGLAQASDSAKMSWKIQNMRFMDRLLLFPVQDAAAWQDKFDAIKTKLFARVFESEGPEKVALMQVILNSSVKKLVTEGVGLSSKPSSWKSLKQLLNNLLFDVSQQLASSSNEADTASLANVKKLLDALLVSAGMAKEEVAPALQVVENEPVPAPVAAVDEKPLEVVPTPASVVPPKSKRPLLEGMMGAAVAAEVQGVETEPKPASVQQSSDDDRAAIASAPRAVSRAKYDI